MPRPTTLIAFRAPVVKGGDAIAIPILTEIGEWSELVATPGTLRNLGFAIAEHFGAPAIAPSHANPSLRQPMLKRGGRIL